jgi:hypothetical protein
MATAMAVVCSARRGVAHVLSEPFSVPPNFPSRLPVRDRAQLAMLKLERLGSGISDEDGRVRIQYGTDADGDGRAAERPHNPWLIGSTVPEAGTPVIAYQEREVREAHLRLT